MNSLQNLHFKTSLPSEYNRLTYGAWSKKLLGRIRLLEHGKNKRGKSIFNSFLFLCERKCAKSCINIDLTLTSRKENFLYFHF